MSTSSPQVVTAELNPHAADLDAADEMHGPLPTAPNPARKTLFVIVGAAAFVCFGAFSVALASQHRQHAALAAETAEEAAQAMRVVVIHPAAPTGARQMILPGSIDALRTTVINARTSGYLKALYVDIGDPVKEGQLLALIEAPEIDAQLEQAQASLAQTRAAREQARTNLEFARVSLERTKTLQPQGVASQQDLDQRQAEHQASTANLVAADANIAAAVANVRRLTELKSFSHVTAPFAGTITERNIELGSLITSGNGTGQALFKIAASNPVRVFASVPQSLAPQIKRGMLATVTVREFPGRPFYGKVTRDAGALDTASRTLLTEVQVPNDDGALLQGMYAQLSFSIQSDKPSLLIDSAVLSITSAGARVAIVREGKIHLQPITIDADLGATLLISEGVTAQDAVVLNPDSRLVEGMTALAVDQSAGKIAPAR